MIVEAKIKVNLAAATFMLPVEKEKNNLISIIITLNQLVCVL